MSDLRKRANTATSREGQRARPTTVKPPSALDPEFSVVVEQEFVSQWYHLAWKGEPVAMEMVEHIPPEALQDQFYREAYTILGELHARGEQLDDTPTQVRLLELAKHLKDPSKYSTLDDYFVRASHTEEDLRKYGRQVLSLYRGRAQLEIVEGAADLTRKAIENGGSVRKVADNLLDLLVGLHQRHSDNGGPVTQDQIADHLLAKLSKERPDGYSWPWPRLQKTLGLITPGKVYGVTAYSGNGKTLFACNLFRELVIRGAPVIVFPTEMDLQWLERAVATLARVPKEYAEEGDWRHATDDEKKRYREAMHSLVGLQWDIVRQPGISPAEVLARAGALRRKYKGQHVVIIVDHAHRLDYGNVSADSDMGAGLFTTHAKNMARSDTSGGLTWFVLYQPPAPEDEEKKYRPVTRIRGHSSSINELDVHLTTWRRIVRCTQTMQTEWGTPIALYEHERDALPMQGTFGAADSKLDDEHFYITNDKHRIRGASLETVVLNIHAPSGYIYEEDIFHSSASKPTTRKDR